ncbi:hypothetical protein GCM10025868_36400 [Angustibacter aerolatus]|uniref:PELOTA RNA-binding domain-containing protein n=1 Tax=Angustibacter aerolatus TaxID=1162965 RepID=A0ABQ6JNR0_9ACTN|nr:cysteine protease StiP domain-containing protein [Angustibacter aerolatus]GMA88390.1 hypothetical protein GCM10025868_36400 [Angustibacter aerolatus]
MLQERGPDAVLVSLARAGTPVGVLMRRWAQQAHGLDLPHLAVSIVRGRGIDTVALRWLAARFRPRDVVYVDGWTGKGAIARELAAAVASANTTLGLHDGEGFDAELAVLADPGSCVRLYGTRADYLIASACLNSTVSGLVSRTVLNDLIGPDDFHGAKFYSSLAGSDVSNAFLDAVSARFDDVREAVAQTVCERTAQPPAPPTWAGWAAVEGISEEYGIGDVNLVKPGVGETTRVLLRRVPWLVLAHPDAAAEPGARAAARGAARGRGARGARAGIQRVGLIHPRFTRGATGADGLAAT